MTKPSAYGPDHGPRWQPSGYVPREGFRWQPPAGYPAPPRPRPRPVRHPEHDQRAFVTLLVATLLMAPVMVLCAVAVLFSPFALDPCTAHGCHALTRALLAAPCLLFLAIAALVTCWALPGRRRFRAARHALAAAAMLLTAATLLVYLNLPAPN